MSDETTAIEEFRRLMPGASSDPYWSTIPDVCAEVAERYADKQNRQLRSRVECLERALGWADRLADDVDRANASRHRRAYLEQAVEHYREARHLRPGECP